MSRIVDDADRLNVRVVSCDDPLDLISHVGVIPLRPTEELLQGSPRSTGEVSNRLHTLARQIGELSANVARQVPARLRPGKAVAKLVEEVRELRREGENLFGCHP